MIRQSIRPYRRELLLATVVSALAAVPALFGPLLIGHGVDAIRSDDRDALERIALIIGLLAFATAVMAALRMVLVTRVAYKIESSLRQRYYDHILDLDLATLERNDPGQLVARGTADLRALRVLFSSGIPTTAQAVATFIFVAVALLIEEAALSTIAFAMAISIAIIARRQAIAATGLQRKVRKEMGELAAQAEQALGGITVIKAFGREHELVKRFQAAAARALAAVRVVTKRDALYNVTLGVLPLIGLVIVMVVGGNLAIDGEALTHGEFVTFFMYFLMMASPAIAVGQVMVLTQDGSAAALRIQEILSLPVVDRIAAQEVRVGEDLSTGGAAVAFHAASAAYDQGSSVIEGFDLRVPKGSLVALVGANGSGKSMALSLVKNLYPLRTGSVEVNGISPTELSLEEQRKLGIVSDEDFLFDGTVREAIAYGRPDATLEDVKRAARIAQIDTFIEQLPNGYNSRVGERGSLLSGGQRQRIAFARALLLQPGLLLSDDAGASLDTPTANALIEAMRSEMPDRTMFIVTRRPSVLAMADMVALIDGGHIVDSGTHAELMARNELYRTVTSAGYRSRTEEDLPVEKTVPATKQAATKKTPKRAVSSPTFFHARGGAARQRLALLWSALKADRRMLIFAGLALTVMTAVNLVPAWLAGRVVDDVLEAGNRARLDELSLALLAATLLWALSAGFAYFLIPWIGQRTMMRLRERLFTHLMRVSMAYFDTASPGRVLSKMVYSLEILAAVFRQASNTVMTALLMMVGTAVALLIIDPLLALIAYATVPIILLLSRLLVSMRKRENKRSLSGMTAISQNLLETVRGMRVIRSFATEQRQRENFAQLNLEERLSLRRAAYGIGTFSLLAELVVGLALAVMVYVGGVQAIEGAIAIGTMVTLTMYLKMALSPLSELATLAVTFGQIGPAIDSASRLLEVHEEKRPQLATTPQGHLETVQGVVKFDHVSFAYTKKRWALRDLSCEILAGSTVAVVGPSGAGKTTFARLLMGFYPAIRGHVLLDGRDVAELDAETLRTHMALVPQEPFLFSGSIADNIAFGRTGVERVDIEQVVESCGAAALLTQLPEGLDTQVHSGGETLSSGQRQVIALCRALIANPSVLVLDEATSVLDAGTESVLQNFLQRERGRRTTISIAHRVELCEQADLVLVFAGGRLVQSGTHQELLKQEGQYARLWQAAGL